ncbi:hypothetical protein BDZ89DRAFT_1076683 [Hymenopellis radicata]|nr:hypothetical protein BDZ89DRAFT_1076683 [Hymenopellis radicata]
MFASSLNFTITHLHIRSPKSRPNDSTRAAGERRPIQKRKSSLNLHAQYHIDSNKSTRVANERWPIQKRKSLLNLRAQYLNIDSARDVARTEPSEVMIHDAYVVVL